MGRYLFQYGVPAALMVYMTWAFLKFWYKKIFPKNIQTMKDLDKTSAKYDKEISK